MFNSSMCNKFSIKIDFINGKRTSPLDRLFHKIFFEDEYSNMVRPIGVNKITHVKTELKLLQIDLVNK